MRDGLADRYEEMRAYAVGAAPGAVPHGLALLIRHGVPAWVEAWASCAPACTRGIGPQSGDGGIQAQGGRLNW